MLTKCFKRVYLVIKAVMHRWSSWTLVHWFTWGIVLGSLQPELTWAAASVDQFARTIRTTFTLVKELLVVVSFVCGMVFAIIGLLKFKAHKDNPAQIPLSTPIVLISVAAALIFLPTFFELAGSAFFGEAAQPGLPLSKTLNF